MLTTMTRKVAGTIIALLTIISAAVSCTSALTDTGEFALYYPGITDIGPSTNMDLTPSWHGGTPGAFEVYKVTLDGEPVTADFFSIDPDNGVFQIRKSDAAAVGKYSISIACSVNGKRFEFPDAIVVNMMPAIPEGITVEPNNIVLLLSQVTNIGSDEELPTAQIKTEGEHISIKNYTICGVRRDGTPVEDWSGLFSVDKTGEFSILKNSAFKAGIYVIDFKLTTMVVGMDSSEGIFTDALTVEIASPPISLAYTPSSSKVEAERAFVSNVPEFMGSATDLEFSIKSIVPQTEYVSIDKTNGVITLAEGHDLAVGEEIVISVSAKNSYGSRDFDQVLKLTIVEYIAPITKFEYNDTTVWQGTKVTLKPRAKDGDEVTYSFEDLPETLSEMSIDASTGVISVAKKNAIALGNYTFKVKAENPKGAMIAQINWNTIENPYAFTYVRWGNNLDLTPAENYANQFRVSVTDPLEIPVAATDIKEGVEVTYAISGGSNTKCATIDAQTGTITTDPSYAAGKVADMRAHFVFVTVKAGVGTSGETSMKIPVFFDFNTLRGDYTIEYTPFAILCNPKEGTTSNPPVIKKNGAELTADELSKITMDFRRSFNYWNLNGPANHKNGAPDKEKTTFLGHIWNAYYTAINVKYNKSSRDPISSYGRPEHISKTAGYVKQDTRALYIAPEKFMDDDGYANGIFTGQITFADTGNDPSKAEDPFRLFPLFVWFDTQF